MRYSWIVTIVAALMLGFLAGLLTFKKAQGWCPTCGVTKRCPTCDNPDGASTRAGPGANRGNSG